MVNPTLIVLTTLLLVGPTRAFTTLPIVGRGGVLQSSSSSSSNHRPESTKLFYHAAGDPPIDAWTALAQTERWISETLQNATSTSTNSNPYSRKEVSFSCDGQGNVALIIAGIWKRLYQARQQGQEHGKQQVQLEREQGKADRTVENVDL